MTGRGFGVCATRRGGQEERIERRPPALSVRDDGDDEEEGDGAGPQERRPGGARGWGRTSVGNPTTPASLPSLAWARFSVGGGGG